MYLCLDAEIGTQFSPSSQGTPCILRPLMTEETNYQRLFWEKQAQKSEIE